jgi:hypothetical protein
VWLAWQTTWFSLCFIFCHRGVEATSTSDPLLAQVAARPIGHRAAVLCLQVRPVFVVAVVFLPVAWLLWRAAHGVSLLANFEQQLSSETFF